MKNAKRNWKTSVFGVILVALGFYQTTQLSQPSEQEISAVVGLMGMGAGLIAAKDGDKSGTAKSEQR